MEQIERNIGEKFTYNGRTFVVKASQTCNECNINGICPKCTSNDFSKVLSSNELLKVFGHCSIGMRKDNTSVVFVYDDDANKDDNKSDSYNDYAIGTRFTHDGDTYEVVEDSDCRYCDAYSICSKSKDKIANKAFRHIFGNCSSDKRSDGKNVMFKKLVKDSTTISSTGGLEKQASSEAASDSSSSTDSNNDVQDVIPLYDNNNRLKTLNIGMPKGYEIDIEECDFAKGVIKFKKKYITIDDVYDKLNSTNIVSYAKYVKYTSGPSTEEELNKNNYLINLANLMDIAQYYNGDWKLNFKEFAPRYFIKFDITSNHFSVGHCMQTNSHCVYFKNKEDCQAVIDNPNFKEILNIIYGNKN